MFIIDRLEDFWAVIEYKGKTFPIPAEILPTGAKEGAVLKINLTLDEEAGNKMRQETENLLNELFTEENENND